MKNIVTIFLAISLSACTNVGFTKKYFYQLGWDKTVHLTGRYPASAKACQNTSCYCLTYDRLNRLVLIEYLEAKTPAIDNFLNVAVVKINYNNKNHRRSFYNTLGEPTTDYDGVHAEILHFIPSLNAWVKQQQDLNGNLVKNVRGVYGYLESLNVYGVKNSSQGFDKNFKLTADSNGVAKKTFRRNSAGFITETRHYNRQGLLVSGLANQIAVTKRRVNEFGDITRIEFFDKDLKPVKVDGFTTIEWEYDSFGNTIKGS